MRKTISKRYIKILFSYMLACITVIGLTFTGLYSFYYEQTYDNILALNATIFKTLRNDIDSVLNELTAISSVIRTNYDMVVSFNNDNPYSHAKFREQLHSYIHMNSFLTDIAVIDFRTDTVQTINAKTSIEEFLLKKEITNEAFIEEVNNIDTGSSKFLQYLTLQEKDQMNEQQSLPYVYSLSSERKIVYFINHQLFENLSTTHMADLKGAFYICDNAYFPYIRYSINNDTQTNIFSTDVNLMERKFVQVDNLRFSMEDDYFIAFIKSASQNFSYAIVSESDYFLKDLNYLKTIFYLFFIAILIISVMLSFVLAKLAYNPIKKLRSKIVLENSTDMFADDFDILQNNYNLVLNNSTYLMKSAEDSKAKLKNHLLIQILEGSIQYSRKITEINNNGITFAPYVQVVGVKLIDSDISIEDEDLIFSVIAKQYEQHYLCFIRRTNIISIVFSSKEPLDPYNDFKDLKDSLKATQVDFCIGIGGIYDSPDDLSRSYSNAIAAINYAVRNKINFCKYADVRSVIDDNLALFIKNKPSLIQAIRQGNLDEAEEIINELFDNLLCEATRRFIYTNIVYDIILLGQRNNYIFTNTQQMIDNDNLNTEQMKQKIMSYAETVSDTINTNCYTCDQQDIKMLDDIIQYINKHFHDPNLCTAELCKQFKYSQSFINKLLKANGYPTAHVIIDNKRMEESKYLLISTNKQVKEIVTEVGFIDNVQFTKKFKKAEGMTPLEYRTANQQLDFVEVN